MFAVSLRAVNKSFSKFSRFFVLAIQSPSDFRNADKDGSGGIKYLFNRDRGNISKTIHQASTFNKESWCSSSWSGSLGSSNEPIILCGVKGLSMVATSHQNCDENHQAIDHTLGIFNCPRQFTRTSLLQVEKLVHSKTGQGLVAAEREVEMIPFR